MQDLHLQGPAFFGSSYTELLTITVSHGPAAKRLDLNSQLSFLKSLSLPQKKAVNGGTISQPLSVKRWAGRRNQLSIESAWILSWLTNPVSSSVSLPISRVPVTVMGVS